MLDDTAPLPKRRYDKGERRYKHVGKGPEPTIEFSPGNPRMWVGKCPSTLTPDDHVRLINEAVPGNNGDRDLEFPKKIYAVENGAIYEGQTTDRGYSYHGYPYRGKLSQGIIDLLRNIATQKSCELEFNAWIKQHIEAHGK